jgi:hypothetical protein
LFSPTVRCPQRMTCSVGSLGGLPLNPSSREAVWFLTVAPYNLGPTVRHAKKNPRPLPGTKGPRAAHGPRPQSGEAGRARFHAAERKNLQQAHWEVRITNARQIAGRAVLTVCFFSGVLVLGATTTTMSAPVLESGAEFSCSRERSLRSVTHDQPTGVTFRNLSGEFTKAYWLNYSGKRVFYRVLTNRPWTVNTYISHPWVITDTKDQCMKIILPGTSQYSVYLR